MLRGAILLLNIVYSNSKVCSEFSPSKIGSLDGLGFWRGAEWIIQRVFGVTRRNDEAMARDVLQSDPGIFGDHLEAVRQQLARRGVE